MPRAYWRVNSYGYPNPLGETANAVQAWTTLESFFQYHSYSELKQFWGSGAASRVIDFHTVESWKAAFEEFGLLYVLSGSDEINITSAGHQFKAAADARNEQQLVWIGLNLLLRYPLKGPRRSRGEDYASSDLLLYWFLYAAMRDLNNYFWWPELEYVLCTVFSHNEATEAIELIRRLRDGTMDIGTIPLPVETTGGAFYNSLNQVVVHASMNYLILGRSTDQGFYDPQRHERRHWIRPEWVAVVDQALGAQALDTECVAPSGLLERMPRAPAFSDEEEFFTYLGAPVDPIPLASGSGLVIREMPFGAGTVAVLREGAHYQRYASAAIRGPIAVVCRLSRGQRIILDHDLGWTYLVADKQLSMAGDVFVRVRPGRPISDPGAVIAFMESANG